MIKEVNLNLTANVFTEIEFKKVIHSIIMSLLADVDYCVNDLNEFSSAATELYSNSKIHSKSDKIDIKVALNTNTKNMVITVRDYGIGVKDVKKIREPLYTTDEERSGLGLTVAEVFSHKMIISNKVNKGLEVIIKRKF